MEAKYSFRLPLSAHFSASFTIHLLRCCLSPFPVLRGPRPLLLRPPHSTNRKLFPKVCVHGGSHQSESRLKWNITHIQARQHFLLTLRLGSQPPLVSLPSSSLSSVFQGRETDMFSCVITQGISRSPWCSASLLYIAFNNHRELFI